MEQQNENPFDPGVPVEETPITEVEIPTEESADQPVEEMGAQNEVLPEVVSEVVPEVVSEVIPVTTQTEIQTLGGPVPSKKVKKATSKKILIILGCIFVVAAVVFAIVFFTVIRPNSIYEDATEALNRGDFSECERLIDQIPNHKETPDLKRKMNLALAQRYIDNGDLDMADSLLSTILDDKRANAMRDEITYYRAEDLVNHGQYEEASLLLDKIPNFKDTKQLHEKIDYETALSCLNIGDYETAYSLFSTLGDYEDAAEQKEIVYYEALAFKSLFPIQDTLKNPASMRVKKVTFYKDNSNDGELDAIFEFNATNSYGGSLGAYGYDLTLYDDTDDSGMISHSSYVDPDDYTDLLIGVLIDSIKKQSVVETNVDVARMNRLLEGNTTFKIDLPFQGGSVVES